uniref:Homing endonuclease LAGLIDADG domain-containing protein n=1 Tax=Chromera velia CCMP2878 TaxID=1169474 RepID=A0A0G4GZ79_9ALVE|eukprot:Cvel_5411.t1-p1 / transcript=Cvel_5411.t1 / gene=Cvel_5411 / organism=Chromera_velia_CCMP2878 / gene_product=hypothetical protein / transcript_product=hypothetical protein / location=Cvel_scaffold252:14776-18024(+) / protein_length=1083 / sequence_SO=supercontig / SO=protein_coding / is_pseudo=false
MLGSVLFLCFLAVVWSSGLPLTRVSGYLVMSAGGISPGKPRRLGGRWMYSEGGEIRFVPRGVSESPRCSIRTETLKETPLQEWLHKGCGPFNLHTSSPAEISEWRDMMIERNPGFVCWLTGMLSTYGTFKIHPKTGANIVFDLSAEKLEALLLMSWGLQGMGKIYPLSIHMETEEPVSFRLCINKFEEVIRVLSLMSGSLVHLPTPRRIYETMNFVKLRFPQYASLLSTEFASFSSWNLRTPQLLAAVENRFNFGYSASSKNGFQIRFNPSRRIKHPTSSEAHFQFCRHLQKVLDDPAHFAAISGASVGEGARPGAGGTGGRGEERKGVGNVSGFAGGGQTVQRPQRPLSGPKRSVDIHRTLSSPALASSFAAFAGYVEAFPPVTAEGRAKILRFRALLRIACALQYRFGLRRTPRQTFLSDHLSPWRRARSRPRSGGRRRGRGGSCSRQVESEWKALVSRFPSLEEDPRLKRRIPTSVHTRGRGAPNRPGTSFRGRWIRGRLTPTCGGGERGVRVGCLRRGVGKEEEFETEEEEDGNEGGEGKERGCDEEEVGGEGGVERFGERKDGEGEEIENEGRRPRISLQHCLEQLLKGEWPLEPFGKNSQLNQLLLKPAGGLPEWQKRGLPLKTRRRRPRESARLRRLVQERLLENLKVSKWVQKLSVWNKNLRGLEACEARREGAGEEIVRRIGLASLHRCPSELGREKPRMRPAMLEKDIRLGSSLLSELLREGGWDENSSGGAGGSSGSRRRSARADSFVTVAVADDEFERRRRRHWMYEEDEEMGPEGSVESWDYTSILEARSLFESLDSPEFVRGDPVGDSGVGFEKKEIDEGELSSPSPSDSSVSSARNARQHPVGVPTPPPSQAAADIQSAAVAVESRNPRSDSPEFSCRQKKWGGGREDRSRSEALQGQPAALVNSLSRVAWQSREAEGEGGRRNEAVVSEGFTDSVPLSGGGLGSNLVTSWVGEIQKERWRDRRIGVTCGREESRCRAGEGSPQVLISPFKRVRRKRKKDVQKRFLVGENSSHGPFEGRLSVVLSSSGRGGGDLKIPCTPAGGCGGASGLGGGMLAFHSLSRAESTVR